MIPPNFFNTIQRVYKVHKPILVENFLAKIKGDFHINFSYDPFSVSHTLLKVVGGNLLPVSVYIHNYFICFQQLGEDEICNSYLIFY